MNKLKSLLVVLFIFGFLSASAPGSFANDPKIAFVDLSRLFDDYYKTKEYDKILESRQNEFATKRNEKIEKIREAQGKLALLKEDKKAGAEQDIEKMKAELLEFDNQEKTSLTKERNEKIREILLEIEKVVSTYAEKEKYAVILNDRVLIYGNQVFNVTEPILQMLNSGQPSAAK